jgi:hypothetical protein
MPAIDWIEIALIAAALPVLWLAFRLAAWEEWDDYRRLERKAHLNLQKQCGR